MKKPREDDIRIATEAARWQQALQNAGPELRVEFADWIKASPRHLREFMFMEALDAAAENIDLKRQIDVELELSALEENVVSLSGSARKSSPTLLPHESAGSIAKRRFTSWCSLGGVSAIAAVLIAALGVTWWLRPGVFGGWERYSTTIGEQRTVELADGSVLQLNTKSRVRVRFDGHSREIRLVEGEALFKVAHDTSRPFRVHTDDAVIRAVGTQFNVNRHSNATRVAVIEGKVEILPVAANLTARGVASQPVVEPATQVPGARSLSQASTSSRSSFLAAGEAAHVEGNGEIIPDVADVSDAVAWRQRRLVFREETLASIAAEFNRYNRSPQLIIEGDVARVRRYGGTFDADDPESLVQFVMRKGDLTAERDAARITIRAR